MNQLKNSWFKKIFKEDGSNYGISIFERGGIQLEKQGSILKKNLELKESYTRRKEKEMKLHFDVELSLIYQVSQKIAQLKIQSKEDK